MTMTTRLLRLRPPPLPLENGESEHDEELLAAPDPLALEPLSDAEIVQLIPTANALGELDEQAEGALEALRKSSEAKLPIDPDAADSMPEAADARLEVRKKKPRRKKKRA